MQNKSTQTTWLVFLLFVLSLTVLLALAPIDVSGSSPAAVLTQHNDNARSGANLNETILNKSNVKASRFGKVFTRTVDGQIYAQPLYVPDVAIPGKGTHNVVYVATEHNTVYAFDADEPAQGAPLWQTNLGFSAPLPNFDIATPDYDNIQIEVGTTSTPVIAPISKTLYVVALTNETSAACTSGCAYAHRLHALNIADGSESFGGPVVITGSVLGSPLQSLAPFPNQPSSTRPTMKSPRDVVTFDSRQHLQRPGLLLVNGMIYIAFGSYGDTLPYHGWVFGYDAHSLAAVSILNTTPNGSEGAIWQAGQGLAADSDGQLYTITGNGTYSDTLGNYGDSFLKLDPSAVVSGVLPVADWFTPYNQDEMNASDLDLGSSGPLLITGTQLIVGGGKGGILYLVDRENMGHYTGPSGPDNVVQRLHSTGQIFGSPVYWSNSQNSLLYVWGMDDGLRAFSFSGGLLDPTPQAVGATIVPFPGGILSLSANGSDRASGILWASRAVTGTQLMVKGVLHAYAASNISVELWNSSQNSTRDAPGNFAKFTPPTIANGKVYLATFSNQLAVYGLLPIPDIYFPFIAR